MLGHRFDAIPDVHLLADVFDVGPHRFDANAQLVADLLVDVAGREKIEHLLFAGRRFSDSSGDGPTRWKCRTTFRAM